MNIDLKRVLNSLAKIYEFLAVVFLTGTLLWLGYLAMLKISEPQVSQEYFVVNYAFKEGIDHNTGWFVFAQSFGEERPQAPKTEYNGPNDIIAMSNQSREIIRAGYVGIEVKGPAGTQGQVASYSGATDSLFGIEKLVVPFWDGQLYVNADCDQSDFWYDQDKNGLMYGGGWLICHRNASK